MLSRAIPVEVVRDSAILKVLLLLDRVKAMRVGYFEFQNMIQETEIKRKKSKSWTRSPCSSYLPKAGLLGRWDIDCEWVCTVEDH